MGTARELAAPSAGLLWWRLQADSLRRARLSKKKLQRSMARGRGGGGDRSDRQALIVGEQRPKPCGDGGHVRVVDQDSVFARDDVSKSSCHAADWTCEYG